MFINNRPTRGLIDDCFIGLFVSEKFVQEDNFRRFEFTKCSEQTFFGMNLG